MSRSADPIADKGRRMPRHPKQLHHRKAVLGLKVTFYASWGPIFWPFLRSAARAPTIKAARGTVAIKAILTIKALGSCYGGARCPYMGR